ncbi:acetyl-CoA hydrolase/transferase family protein [Henriciella mobilis]|uniref:Acetyl-CoA hydrolase/transferase family protein n=1 Tax=Henriciella mobilis TaxID=2305467 RepID=A0A399R9Y8_9PROT|nr:acetyl-CoA hydrolase/transferase C-terminal domain-containing protein [Henriciella mobilis]RIJ28396.1 acetyl-CoA hydrolase/transferase family protein [Henriciella mobilis]
MDRDGIEIALDALDWPALVRPGSLVVWGQGCAEPNGLTAALMDARHAVGPFRAFAGISYGPSVSPGFTDAVSYLSYCGTGQNRTLGRALDILPVHYSRLARTLEQIGAGELVLMIRLAPGADADHFSFGAGADYTADLLRTARLVIAEVSSQTPTTGTGREIRRSDIDIIVRTDTPCLVLPTVEMGDIETRIARHVAGLVHDGATIQIGLGTLPQAILDALHGHKDLGVHSGLVTQGIADLMDAGVITNARKSFDRSTTVAGLLAGGEPLMQWANGNPRLSMRPSTYTHAADILAGIDNFTAINSAIEVDLTGQVNAEVAGGRYVGAVGGAVDFMRGARASRGGAGIIALPSTARGRSRIVNRVSGPVTTSRADVGFVVTEHGIADLRFATLTERRDRLLAIAAPEHQAALADGDAT